MPHKLVVELFIDSTPIVLIQGDDDFGLSSAVWTSFRPAKTVIPNCIESVSSSTQSIVPEQHTSTVGGLTFRFVDRTGLITAALQAEAAAGRDEYNATVRMWSGFEAIEPGEFANVATQFIQKVSVDGATIIVRATDTWDLAKVPIFSVKRAKVRASYDKATTTIPVDNASVFQGIFHEQGSWYVHANNGLTPVAYVRVGDEIMEFDANGVITTSGNVSDRLVMRRRGHFGTAREEYVFDPDQDPPDVVEFVYMEGTPVAIARAILTGEFEGTSTALPAHWHAGIDPTLLSASEWTQAAIGQDVYNQASPGEGYQIRVWGVEDFKAKAFLEQEIFPAAQVYSPALPDGTLGLRRVTPVVSQGPAVQALTETFVTRAGQLQKQASLVRNVFRIEWNVSVEGDIRRKVVFADTPSIQAFGRSEEVALRLPVVHESTSSEEILVNIKNNMRERYTVPPIDFRVSCRAIATLLDVGDLVRVNLPRVRDPWATGLTLNRVFEIRKRTVDWMRLKVDLELRTYQYRAPPVNDCSDGTVLFFNYYQSAGAVEVGTVLSLNGSRELTADGTLTGASTLEAGLFYSNGDLTIPSGITLTIEQNVTLRVRGVLTVNGTILGGARGQFAPLETEAGLGQVIAGPNTLALTRPPPATPGAVGWVQSPEGRAYTNGLLRFGPSELAVQSPPAGVRWAGLPSYQLVNQGIVLRGMPSVLWGTSGQPGGHLFDLEDAPPLQYRQYNGGAGGRSGAGLLIICRGMIMGASGYILLNGGAGGDSQLNPTGDSSKRAGGGAGGAPGGLLVLLDGALVPVPTFIPGPNTSGGTFYAPHGNDGADNRGRPQPPEDLSEVAFRVQFIPCPIAPKTLVRFRENPAFQTTNLAGQVRPQLTFQHTTESGNVRLRLRGDALASSPSTADRHELIIERRNLTAGELTFTGVLNINDKADGAFALRTLPDDGTTAGEGLLAIDRDFNDRGLTPGEYEYRVTFAKVTDGSDVAFDDANFEVLSKDEV